MTKRPAEFVREEAMEAADLLNGGEEPLALTIYGGRWIVEARMLRIGIIGVGAHSWLHHLPSLKECLRRNPGKLELSAVCDLNFEMAREAEKIFGFKNSYGSIREMLEIEKLDGIIAVTPFEHTCAIAMDLLDARIPLLIEKPPACRIEEAEALEKRRGLSGVPVMVSLNRRHEAMIGKLKQVVRNGRKGRLEVRFFRSKRTESWFLFETGIHFLDTINYLCGPVVNWSVSPIGGADRRRCVFESDFESGTTCRVVIDPMAGELEESYAYLEEGIEAVARFGDRTFPDSTVFRLWKAGQLVEECAEYADTPTHERMGTIRETEAFIRVVSGESDPEPALSEVLPSLKIAIQLKDWSKTVVDA